jgi:Arc/MetJ-type ribon-helix-helix transcriptional regulator
MPTTKRHIPRTSIRLTAADKTNADRIIKAGWAANRTDAIRYALRLAVEAKVEARVA